MADKSLNKDISQVKQRTVALIEDSFEDRATYRRYLQRDSEYQYIFLEAETEKTALEMCQQEQIDIILLDYLLPDINGLEWLSRWQQRLQPNSPPVIALTGQGDENIAVQFIKMGASDYIVKNQLTSAKLKLSVDRAITLQQLEREKQDLIERLISRNQKLIKSNRKYRQEIAKNERLRKIVDNVPAVVYAKEIDSQTSKPGKLWLINKEFQRIFARKEKEAIGKTDYDLFPQSVADALRNNDRTVIETGEPLFTEEEVYHADGQLHTYLSLKFPLIEEEQIVSIAGIATDITKEKQTQTQLKQSESMFRNTFEQAAVGIAHVSVDGKWLKVNQRLCDIVGYTKEELLQKNFQDLTHPSDLDADMELANRVLIGEIDNYSLEKRYVCKDRDLVWINLTVSLVKDEQNEPDYFIYVIEDISKRQSLKSSLQKSLRRLSNLHQIDKAILEVQQPQAIAQKAINNIQKLLTCQRTSIVTFDWEAETATILATWGQSSETVDGGFQVSLNIWQDTIAQLESEQNDYVIYYLSQFTQLSEIVPLFKDTDLDCVICFPLKAKDKFLGILKVWVEDPESIVIEDFDIVGEVCNQIAIALQQARLYRQAQNYTLELEARVAQRTAQLQDINHELKAFTYSISHDLKAPLRAIQGFATALQEDYTENLDDLGKEYTGRLVASAQQMERLIQDLLTYSRLSRSEIQLQSIDLSRIVKQAIAQLQLEINETRAKIIIDEPLLTMLGNKAVLLQVVTNLLSNALKFVAVDTPPVVHIWGEIKGDRLRLWVEDNGIGIKEQHQKRIFQVFERLHGSEVYSGTGIGLAIVKKAMERLGGSCGLESEPDRGSRFWIEGKIN